MLMAVEYGFLLTGLSITAAMVIMRCAGTRRMNPISAYQREQSRMHVVTRSARAYRALDIAQGILRIFTKVSAPFPDGAPP